jgi:hypothetical protein
VALFRWAGGSILFAVVHFEISNGVRCLSDDGLVTPDRIRVFRSAEEAQNHGLSEWR